MRGILRFGSVVVIGVLMLALAACGSDGSSDNGSDAKSSSSLSAQDVQKEMDDLYEGASFRSPGTDGPPAVSGKTVALINVGQQAPTGALITRAAKEANEYLKWNLEIYDAGFSPDKFQEGIRSAVARKVDAIWLFSIDCPLAQKALDEANEAGIPTIAQESADCNQVEENAPSLFTESLKYVDGDFVDFSRAMGASQATWLMSETDLEAKVIEVQVPDLIVADVLHEGFVDRMAECGSCEIVETIKNSASALGPELQQKVSQAILQHPEANALAVSYDDLMLAGVAAAVRESGRKDELHVISGTGLASAMDLIRNDAGLDAGYGWALEQEGWASMDLVNRVLAGAEPANSGIGVQIYDADHNLPASGAYKSPVEFKQDYIDMWTK